MSAAAKPRPARVLYVVSLFPCWSETFIVREIAALIKAGVDVRILSLKRPSEKMVQPDAAALMNRALHPRPGVRGWPAIIVAGLANIRIVAAAKLRIVGSLWRHPALALKSLFALARGLEHLSQIRAFDPQFIHAHWATYPSTVAATLARILGRPYGFTCHAHDIFVDDHLLRWKIETAALPVTISRYNVDWLTAHTTPQARERLHVVHCGADLKMFPYRRAGRADDLLIGVGRLDPIKGFDVLIEALAMLAKEGRTFRCKLIGEGAQRAQLESSIARHDLAARIELLGARPQAEVRELLYAATAFVLPCVIAADGNRDGIPVALMEAMAAGTPVISARVSGIPELIEDGCEGLLIAERDVAALAVALRRVLDEDDLRERCAFAARAKVEREFDAEREGEKLLQLMGEVFNAG
ncbi:MAG: glycosyltransferase [Dokdonella sp.]